MRNIDDIEINDRDVDVSCNEVPDDHAESIYRSPYRKKTHAFSVQFSDPVTGKHEIYESERIGYQDGRIDPNLRIPAGTLIFGKPTKHDCTNLERMQAGKAPFARVPNPDGSVSFVRYELHHLSGEERDRWRQHFSGIESSGSLVELRSDLHKAYSRQIHGMNPTTSFRTAKVKVRGDFGSIRRIRIKTPDDARFNAFRRQYWKDCAADFAAGTRVYSATVDVAGDIYTHTGGIAMAFSRKLTRGMDTGSRLDGKVDKASGLDGFDNLADNREKKREAVQDKKAKLRSLRGHMDEPGVADAVAQLEGEISRLEQEIENIEAEMDQMIELEEARQKEIGEWLQQELETAAEIKEKLDGARDRQSELYSSEHTADAAAAMSGAIAQVEDIYHGKMDMIKQETAALREAGDRLKQARARRSN